MMNPTEIDVPERTERRIPAESLEQELNHLQSRALDQLSDARKRLADAEAEVLHAKAEMDRCIVVLAKMGSERAEIAEVCGRSLSYVGSVLVRKDEPHE